MKPQTLIALLTVGSGSAFVAQQAFVRPSTNLAAVDRRHFLEASSAAFFLGSLPAFALEDLGELTPEEKEAAEVG